MSADEDLTKPLGVDDRGHRFRGAALFGIAAFGLFVAAGASVSGYLWLTRDQGSDIAGSLQTLDTTTLTGSTAAGDGIDADTISGLIEITPDGGLRDIGDVIIHDPSDGGAIRLAALPDIDLVEEGPYGPLPRVSTSGMRPLEAYARPTSATAHSDRIAIVIGGIGINARGTSDAIRDLPGTVTLALAPYGEAIEDAVYEARGAGHELLLQVPLEPFNYPDTDPGPHTLTRDAGEATNIDRLHWLLARATNYIGVMNYLGARFTSDAEALSPVLAEIGRRGLLYLDDGSSGRSLADTDARGRTPVVRADVILDADLSAAAIDARLDQLQALARKRGWAIATGSAFPLTVERVRAFADRARDRGIQIVPLSALVARPG